MAWPKRGTRTIVVDGEPFAWHYDAHCVLCSDDVVTAGKQGSPHYLFIDPYPWGMEIRPRGVADAIRWARSEGWTAEHGPTRAVALDDSTQAFRWLAEGQRHLGCPKDDGRS
jgi:hypothetical protein